MSNGSAQGKEVSSFTNQDPASILSMMDAHFEHFIFLIFRFQISIFPDFKIPRFPDTPPPEPNSQFPT